MLFNNIAQHYNRSYRTWGYLPAIPTAVSLSLASCPRREKQQKLLLLNCFQKCTNRAKGNSIIADLPSVMLCMSFSRSHALTLSQSLLMKLGCLPKSQNWQKLSCCLPNEVQQRVDAKISVYLRSSRAVFFVQFVQDRSVAVIRKVWCGTAHWKNYPSGECWKPQSHSQNYLFELCQVHWQRRQLPICSLLFLVICSYLFQTIHSFV